MGTTIVIVLLLGAGVLAYLGSRTAKGKAQAHTARVREMERDPSQTPGRLSAARKDLTAAVGATLLLKVTAALFIFAGLLALFLNSYTIVPAKHVAVVTTFGKPVDATGHGWQWHAPWSEVTTFDGTIQGKTLAGDGAKGDGEVEVRLADGGRAWVSVTLQWRVNADDRRGVMSLFADYRNPARVDENFVERNLRAALYDAFGTYDPLAGIGVEGAPPTRTPAAVGADALKLLGERAQTKGVSFISLTVQGIRFDGTTEKRINDRRELEAAKRNAELQKAVNERVAAANNALAAGARDEGTLYQQCLALTERMLREGKAMPLAWTCGAGGPAPVVPIR